MPFLLSPSGHGRDVSDRFLELLAREEAGEDVLPPSASAYTYLIVGGIFTEHYPGYMVVPFARMARGQFDARRVPIDTEGSVEANAEVVRDTALAAFRETGRRVVLIGHSKGGVDVTTAVALYPELLPLVHAVVTMAAPYHGSQLVDDVVNSRMFASMAGGVIEGLLDGDPQALFALSTAARGAFVAAHPYPESVPTVSLAASSDAEPEAPLRPLVEWLLSTGHQPNDGLVSAVHAYVPGADLVHVGDIDHAEAAFSWFSGPGAHDPGAILAAMLTLALERAARLT